MNCPKCGKDALTVRDSRERKTKTGKYRKRFCTNCGYKFRTIERYSYKTIQEIPASKIWSKTERNLQNIVRIKELAQKMNIKLAEE